MSKAIKLTIVIILIVGALLAVGYFVFIASGSFDVVHGGSRFASDTDNQVSVKGGQAFVFRCEGSAVKAGYDVKIVPADNADFDFIVDGRHYPFADETDLTTAFTVEMTETGFILYIPQGITMEKVLQTVKKGHAVEVGNIALAKNLAIQIVPKNAEPVTITLNFGG